MDGRVNEGALMTVEFDNGYAFSPSVKRLSGRLARAVGWDSLVAVPRVVAVAWLIVKADVCVNDLTLSDRLARQAASAFDEVGLPSFRERLCRLLEQPRDDELLWDWNVNFESLVEVAMVEVVNRNVDAFRPYLGEGAAEEVR